MKTGDTFVGWTGSNGDNPQQNLVIANGSTGELKFYANFLKSGSEDNAKYENISEDRIWASGSDLFIRTSTPGNIVRIYSTEGVLQKIQTIVSAGETKIRLEAGIYAVTLNNEIGQVIKIKR